MILIAASTIRQAALVAEWIGDRSKGWKYICRPQDLHGVKDGTLYLGLPVLGHGGGAFWEMLELAHARGMKIVEVHT